MAVQDIYSGRRRKRRFSWLINIIRAMFMEYVNSQQSIVFGYGSYDNSYYKISWGKVAAWLVVIVLIILT